MVAAGAVLVAGVGMLVGAGGRRHAGDDDAALLGARVSPGRLGNVRLARQHDSWLVRVLLLEIRCDVRVIGGDAADEAGEEAVGAEACPREVVDECERQVHDLLG